MPLVAIVLPPREGFGPGRTGAVGLIVRRLADAPGFRAVVIGGPQAGPTFPGVAFREARPPFWLPGNANVRHAAGVVRLVRALRPALIEVHNRTETALALARWLPDTRIALFLHNDPQSMRQARTPAERTTLLRRMARVVTVSDYLSDRLLEGVTGSVPPPVVLPNCIDLAALSATPSPAPVPAPMALGRYQGPRPGLPQEQDDPPPEPRAPEILFVGRVVPEKAPDAFVAACAAALPSLPGWRATIIGADRFRADSPETAFVRSVRAGAEAAGVRMLGYRDHPDVLAALKRAAIAVVPSRWQEPFGLTALEAMATGAALIASPRGGLPEVAGDAALYADPDDPPAIAAAILALATDQPRREALAAAGRARARRFDLAPTLRRLAALRTALLAGG
jgi:glycosyltransferase involved in cell wall biosynthesis